LLLHGALAEKKGCGIILAGPSDVGKTTASQYFPSPWHSLSDDTTLVVCDKYGVYWAHPWPTWSDYLFNRPGGTWNVPHAVPLAGIFFLIKAQDNKAEPIDVGEAVCLLVESVKQVSLETSHGMGRDELRAYNSQRFNNICTLAQTVPCYYLYLSLTGAFWLEIERVLAERGNSV